MTTNLQHLFRHNLWANRLILDACAALAPDQLDASVVGTYGSIGRTLAHLVSAEDAYAARLGRRPRQIRWDEESPVPPIDELRRSWSASARSSSVSPAPRRRRTSWTGSATASRSPDRPGSS